MRITALSEDSILGLKQVGLSSLRFYSIPVLALEHRMRQSAQVKLSIEFAWTVFWPQMDTDAHRCRRRAVENWRVSVRTDFYCGSTHT